MGSLVNVSMANCITEMQTHNHALDEWVYAGNVSASYNFIYLKDVFASIIKVAWGDAFDSTTAVLRNCDLKFGSARPVTPPWTGGFKTLWDCGILMLNVNNLGYISSVSCDIRWSEQFNNPFDLLKSLALNFGLVARYFFGKEDGTYDPSVPANNLHRLEFLTRGTAFGTTVTMVGGIIESNLVSDTPLKTRNIRTQDVRMNDNGVDKVTNTEWVANGRFVSAAPPNDPPNDVNFDLDLTLQVILDDRNVSIGAVYNDYRFLFFLDVGENEATSMDQMKYYDYTTADWSTTTPILLQDALCHYFYARFTQGRKMFTRTYASMQATESGTTSHNVLKPLKRISIDDGFGAITYYATEVRKDFGKNTSTVLWIQE
jgi:hypothetical protein